MAETIERWETFKLLPSETVVAVVTASFRWTGLGYLVLAVATAVTVFAIPVVALMAYYSYWSLKQNRYAITNQRILGRTGLFNKRSINLLLSRVSEIETRRPLMCNFFGNGSVVINTVGGLGKQVVLGGQHDPDTLQDTIQSVLQHKS